MLSIKCHSGCASRTMFTWHACVMTHASLYHTEVLEVGSERGKDAGEQGGHFGLHLREQLCAQRDAGLQETCEAGEELQEALGLISSRRMFINY